MNYYDLVEQIFDNYAIPSQYKCVDLIKLTAKTMKMHQFTNQDLIHILAIARGFMTSLPINTIHDTEKANTPNWLEMHKNQSQYHYLKRRINHIDFIIYLIRNNVL